MTLTDLHRPELSEIIPKNDLEKYFLGNDKRWLHKWFHYFEIY